MALKKPPLEEHLLRNVFFDTCVYHQPGIDLLLDVIPTHNILFASEMIGAVRDIDPCTDHYFDDTRQYIEHSGLPESDLAAIQEHNVRTVYPRLNSLIKQQGR
jgi:4-oxalmesaconate hydratase